MIDADQKTRLRPKTIITGVVICSACALVSYNVIFFQDKMANRAGSTAVRVEVKDMDVAPNPDTGVSSIGQLVDQTSSGGSYGHARVLTSSIQTELGKLGFYKGAVDGKDGPQTQSAILRYQRQVELQPTGKISQSLLDHIRLTRKISESAGITGSVPQPVRTNQKTISDILSVTQTQSAPRANIQVLQVQEKLAKFGYKLGKVDGLIGKSTISAIKQFEKDRDMIVTGKISAALKSELGL